MKKPLLIGGAILCMFTAILLVLINSIDPGPFIKNGLKYDLFKEFVKFYIQTLFVALAGGIIVQEYNRSVQRRLNLKAFRKEVYKSLVDVYLKTKKVRWSLRANNVNNCLPVKVYREELARIIESKASVEIIVHEIKAYSRPFKVIEADLLSHLKEMEDYLRELLSEYHNNAATFNGNCVDVDLQKFQRMHKFIEVVPADQKSPDFVSDFTARYRKPFYNALELLRENEPLMIGTFALKY